MITLQPPLTALPVCQPADEPDLTPARRWSGLARRALKGLIIASAAALLLQACSSVPRSTSGRGQGGASEPGNAGASSRPATPPVSTTRRPGGYYQDDGPGPGAPDIESIPDAVPRAEPLASRANRPYSVFGIQYIPLTELKPYREKGTASWYGRKFHGQATSNGERYDMYAMTAAHPTLPLPSYVRVSNPRNGKTVIVRVNDRGPFLHSRIIDLSCTAAAKLGYVNQGSTEVEIELIDDPVRFAMAGQTRPAGQPNPGLPAPVVMATATPDAAQKSPASPPASGVTTGTTASVSGGGSMGPASAGTPASGTTSGISSGTAAGPQPGPSSTPTAGSTDGNPGTPPAGKMAAGDGALVLTRETLISGQTTTAAPGLYLQVGAFSARESAEATRQRLTQQFPWLAASGAGKPDYLLRAEAGMFKLHIGPFKSRAEATSSIERLKSESGLQAFLVTR